MRRLLAISLLLGFFSTVATSWLLSLRLSVSGTTYLCYIFFPANTSPDRDLSANFAGRFGLGFEMYVVHASRTRAGIPSNPPKLFVLLNDPRRIATTTPRISPWAAPLMFPWQHNRPWPDGVRRLHAIAAHGWPFPAMWSRYASSLQSVGDLGVHDHAIPIPNREIEFASGYQLPSALPLGIAGPGFTANTAIYAAAWLSLLLTARTLRAASRRRRNLCPHCSYPLSSLPPNSPCPECGAQTSNLKAESSNARTPL